MFRPKPGARIELHVLKSHAASRLNRDGMDRPKTMHFGGCRRLRISSQSEKYSIRHSEIFSQLLDHANEKYGAVRMIRTRQAINRIQEKLEEKIRPTGEDPAQCQDIIKERLQSFKKIFSKKQSGKDNQKDTTQLVAFSMAEIDRIVEMIFTIDNKEKIIIADAEQVIKDVRSERTSVGPLSVELQLFGRFTTAFHYLKNIDPPLSLNHGFTIHESRIEWDYWTAVDDLNRLARKQDSGHLDSRAFGAGVFYHYYCLDVPLLSRNIHGAFTNLDDSQLVELTQDVIAAFLYAACCRNPVGAQTGHANYNLPGYAYLTYGNAFPYSADDAFEQPIQATGKGYLHEGRNALQAWIETRRKRYGIFSGFEQGMGLDTLDSDLQTMIESTVQEATPAIHRALVEG